MSTSQPSVPQPADAQIATTTSENAFKSKISATVGTVTCANLPLQNAKIKVVPEEILQKSDTCRKYIWGICDKQSQCKFVHKLDVEEMKKILKFCHDHQNKSGCTREGCTYLHVSKEEENLFYTKNLIPKVLLERHEALSKGVIPSKENKVKPVFQGENYVFPPPLPTPLPTLPLAAQSQTPVVTTATTTTVTTTTTTATVTPNTPTVSSTVKTKVAPPIFVAAQPSRSFPGPVNAVRPSFQANGPRMVASPQFPMMCDITRPPPPLPQQVPNGQTPPSLGFPSSRDVLVNGTKRKWPFDAGASKTKAVAVSQTTDELCDDCVQREIRISQYNKQIEKMLCDEADKNLIYQKKLAEFKQGKTMLMSIVGSENQRMIEEYVEGMPDLSNNLISHLLQAQNVGQSGFSTTSGSLTMHTILQLLEILVASSKRSNNIINKIGQINQSSRLNTTDDVPPILKQTLSSLSRRMTVNQSPQQDQSQLLFEIIQHCHKMLNGENGTNGIDLLNSSTNRQNLNITPNVSTNSISNITSNNRTQSNSMVGTLGQFVANGINNYVVNTNGIITPNTSNQQVPVQMYNPTSVAGYGVNNMVPPTVPMGYFGQGYGQPQGVPPPGFQQSAVGYQYSPASTQAVHPQSGAVRISGAIPAQVMPPAAAVFPNYQPRSNHPPPQYYQTYQ